MAKLWTRLAEDLRPDAVEVLKAMMPNGPAPVVMNQELRIALMKFYVSNSRQAVGSNPDDAVLLTFLKDVDKNSSGQARLTQPEQMEPGLPADQGLLAALRLPRRPRPTGSPLPVPIDDPGANCTCSCYSGLTWLACSAGFTVCCLGDAPMPHQDPVPLNTELTIPTADGERGGLLTKSTGCPSSASATLQRNTTAIVYSSERMAKIWARLAEDLRPDAVEVLKATMPNGPAPVVMNQELRIALMKFYASNSRQAVGSNPDDAVLLTFLKDVEEVPQGQLDSSP